MKKAPTKKARVLHYLLNVSSLNRFEAEDIGDHCLPSTISEFANDHGIIFVRVTEKVSTHWGAGCDVTRYSLEGCERDKAAELLEKMLARNGKH